MNTRTYTDQVKLAAAGHWDGILQAVCGLSDDEVNPRRYNRPCPHCGGRDRYSFKSVDDGNYICRQCGSGDGFSLIMKVQECRFPEAVEQVGRYLGIERKSYRDEAEALAEQARIAAMAQSRKEQREQEQAREAAQRQQNQHKAAARAASMLNTARPATPTHPYLVRKQLPPMGLLQQGSLLLVGLYTHGHRLVNIEHITSKGAKFGLKYGQREAIYHRFGADAWTVYVCEGWATGASLYLMDNQSVRVYSAMGKGNLEAVARIAREQNPESRLIIAADNDTHLPGNPGITQALKAAEVVEAAVLLPTLAQPTSKGTDFSDFYLAKGGLTHGAM